ASVTLPCTKWKRGSCSKDVRLRRRPVDRSSSAQTSSPCARRDSTRWDPMNPAPPVTRILMISSPSVEGAGPGLSRASGVVLDVGQASFGVALVSRRLETGDWGGHPQVAASMQKSATGPPGLRSRHDTPQTRDAVHVFSPLGGRLDTPRPLR